MKINFSILWFDDDEDYLDSLDLEPVEEAINSWGLSPNITCVSTATDFNRYSPYHEFDLIVVDRNLEEYGEGQEFIKQLREHSVYTEVIFYTAGNVEPLWEAIYSKKLEGVFIATKQTINERILSVGQQSVRKILDLENMRGIVMAEVGELDLLFDDILIKGMAGLTDIQQANIFDKFYANYSKQLNQSATTLEDFKRNPDAAQMMGLCDSNKRWQSLNRLCKKHESLTANLLSDYVEDVLDPRNCLAHGKPEQHSTEGLVFKYSKYEFRFTDETSRELRKTILNYKKHLKDILAKLKSKET